MFISRPIVTVLVFALGAVGCSSTSEGTSGEPSSDGSPTHAARSGVPSTEGSRSPSEGGANGGALACSSEVNGTAQEHPLGTVLVLAWERLDGKFFVERDRVALADDRASFNVKTGAPPPPVDARLSSSVSWLAIGRVYAVSSGEPVSGLVDGASLRSVTAAGTYRDALVWSDAARPEDAGGTWASRTPPGYSVWRCADGAPKKEAFVESTCNGLRLVSGGDPTGDLHCDWH